MKKFMKKTIFAMSLGIFSSSLLLIFHPNVILADVDNQNNDVFYVAKFVCGSIEGNEGPLRPGHYDTSISILNKQVNKTSFYWNASLENGSVSHSTLISLDGMYSTGLNCENIVITSYSIHYTKLYDVKSVCSVKNLYFKTSGVA